MDAGTCQVPVAGGALTVHLLTQGPPVPMVIRKSEGNWFSTCGSTYPNTAESLSLSALRHHRRGKPRAVQAAHAGSAEGIDALSSGGEYSQPYFHGSRGAPTRLPNAREPTDWCNAAIDEEGSGADSIRRITEQTPVARIAEAHARRVERVRQRETE